VLVLDTAKGGVASAWMLREMASRGVVPLAIVFNSVNPILVQGAAFGDVTMLAGFDGDITAAGPQRRDRRDRSGGPAPSRALARSPPARERGAACAARRQCACRPDGGQKAARRGATSHQDRDAARHHRRAEASAASQAAFWPGYCTAANTGHKPACQEET
jgi:hypothetical protein